MMNGRRKSERSVVSVKSPNNTAVAVAEEMEKRDCAKRNTEQQNTRLTQSRTSVRSALSRVCQRAKENKKERFTALFHHVYHTDTLRVAFFDIQRSASAGVDGVMWSEYEETLEENIGELSRRLKQGAYRAKPVRRTYIPKADGRMRPLGVTALEDKIVQRAMVMVLQAVYENDFLGFSYGFRPGRGQHNALDAVHHGIWSKKVNWVLDADIRGFFDAIDHEWLIRFIEHRIADRRAIRLIQKWLKAGVLDQGTILDNHTGVPQGASISPLLGNIYLHYVLDLWAQHTRRDARGDIIIVRYADDFILGFEHEAEAISWLTQLKQRFERFGLELHPEKTRLIRFGRLAEKHRRERGLSKPETFDFLGFTHICGKTRNGKFAVLRQTMKKKFRALLEVKLVLCERRHRPVPETGAWLSKVVTGHYRYYGVPGNFEALSAFRLRISKHWRRSLQRRSQKHRLGWTRMKRIVDKWLPLPQIVHPYPSERIGINTRGKSPVR